MTDVGFERFLRIQHKTGGMYGPLYAIAASKQHKRPQDVRSDYGFFKWVKEFLEDPDRALLDGAFRDFQAQHSVGNNGEPAAVDPEHWQELFDTKEEFEKAPPLSFDIEGFLQRDTITGIAGLAGQGKSFTALSIARGLLFGPGRLWDLFNVVERAERVVYYIPEATRGPVYHRVKLFGLELEIGKRLFIRTLSKGPTPALTDPRVLRAAKGAHNIIDTAIRFMGAIDDAKASEVAEALSNDFLELQRAEARSVISLFHSPKSFRKESEMTLENMVRGSGEFGAVLSTCWGIKQLDVPTNTIHVQNIKPRDFEPCGPFQIQGRPHINEKGDFALLKRPEECGWLSEEQPELNKNNTELRKQRNANIALVGEWLQKEPTLQTKDIRRKFAALKIELGDSTIRSYRQALGGEE